MSAVPCFKVLDAVTELRFVAVFRIVFVRRSLLLPIFGKHENVSANVLWAQSAFKQKNLRLLITISTFFSCIGKSLNLRGYMLCILSDFSPQYGQLAFFRAERTYICSKPSCAMCFTYLMSGSMLLTSSLMLQHHNPFDFMGGFYHLFACLSTNLGKNLSALDK